jgi:hypothetical protein
MIDFLSSVECHYFLSLRVTIFSEPFLNRHVSRYLGTTWLDVTSILGNCYTVLVLLPFTSSLLTTDSSTESY